MRGTSRPPRGPIEVWRQRRPNSWEARSGCRSPVGYIHTAACFTAPPTGGADLTFATPSPRVSFAYVKSKSSTRINKFASGPLILTFAKVPA